MKKFFFYFFLFIIFFVLIYLLNIISKKFILKNYGSVYSKDSLIVYKKYYRTVNHLRDPWNFDSEDLIFTLVGSGDKSIIFQGDSWSEQLTNELNKNKLLNFSQINDFKMFLAGTSSYSPSLYNSQLDLLLTEFNVDPYMIVTFFDHTDIGDELCRYKDLILKKNGKFIVLPYADHDKELMFNVESTFKRINILVSNDLSLLIFAKLSILKIYEKFIQKKYVNCNADKVLGYLKQELSIKEKKYLKQILKRYFNNVLNIKNLKQFLIITHPHREHVSKDYTLKIDDLIQETIQELPFDERITFLRFENILNNYINNQDLETVFVEGDKFSHLQGNYYYNYYLKNVLNKIMN